MTNHHAPLTHQQVEVVLDGAGRAPLPIVAVDPRVRERWELSEGPEIEGRYLGLHTLFVNAAASPATTEQVRAMLQAGAPALDRFEHLYLSVALHPAVAEQLALAWLERWGGMRPVTVARDPVGVLEFPAWVARRVHLQLILWVGGALSALKTGDCVRVDAGELRTYSFVVGDACAVTEPHDYAVDREVRFWPPPTPTP